MATPFTPPSSVLIVGAGVFGLSTAYALARRDVFASTVIIVVDRSETSEPGVFPSRDASSVDNSRIIRADYADPFYAALASEALVEWRKTGADDLGGQGRYNESGLILVADDDGSGLHLTANDARPAEKTPATASQQTDAKKTGLGYVRASWENVLAMAAHDPVLARNLRLLPTPDAIRDAVGTGGGSGSWGYFNGCSGWADAEASMEWLLERVRRTGRVRFVPGTVESLAHHGNRVTGVKLQDGQSLSADLVVLAAGAWTPSLIDLSGRAVATGQVLAYVDLSAEEQRQLQHMPMLLNLTTGLFVITPVNRVLKIARHAYGYLNRTTTASPLRPPGDATPLPNSLVSIPLTHRDTPSLSIPAEGATALRHALREMVPLASLADRPFARTRLCWYTDTPTGDFVVDYHPEWQSLFVATGGSGHAFKFLPVLGERVVDIITGRRGRKFADKWRWTDIGDSPAGDAVVTEDGSRGGRPGLHLDQELAKSTTS